MSAKPRCGDCKHRRGSRRLDRIITDTPKKGQEKNIPRTGETRKKPCSCECHSGVPA